MNDFRETLYTIDTKGNRKWVYPAEITGFFKKRRNIVVSILILIYVALPWILINGQQAVFLDIANRKFVFFGETFWATDTKFLFLTLCSLAITLFFFTSIFGRIWCGWACPQTVFMEFIYRPLERLIEGDANQRRKLDKAPWTLSKIKIKGIKYITFMFVSWYLASTVLAYFIGRERLITMMMDYPWNNLSTYLLTLALMGILTFQFGWFREQFCTVLCPYARFQSVLLDDSSLLVGYDTKRGEPRGKQSETDKGDCIDCGLCTRVCPTGIDIRNGLQLECIQCALCADACDSIMTKVGRPLGLIRYDTERGLRGERTKFLRPRVLVYATILGILLTTFGYFLTTRELSEAQILHAKDSLFKTLPDGRIENHLDLHLSNKDEVVHYYSVSVENAPEVELVMPINPFPVPASTVSKAPLFVHLPANLLSNGTLPVVIVVKDESNFKVKIPINILGPG